MYKTAFHPCKMESNYMVRFFLLIFSLKFIIIRTTFRRTDSFILITNVNYFLNETFRKKNTKMLTDNSMSIPPREIFLVRET